MSNEIAILRGWRVLNRRCSRAAASAVARPVQDVASATESAATRSATPTIVEILDGNGPPINQMWFWAMVKTFGG